MIITTATAAADDRVQVRARAVHHDDMPRVTVQVQAGDDTVTLTFTTVMAEMLVDEVTTALEAIDERAPAQRAPV